jgi:hypothetical protein
VVVEHPSRLLAFESIVQIHQVLKQGDELVLENVVVAAVVVGFVVGTAALVHRFLGKLMNPFFHLFLLGQDRHATTTDRTSAAGDVRLRRGAAAEQLAVATGPFNVRSVASSEPFLPVPGARFVLGRLHGW